ncbi:MAG TPA: RidA family protein [Defluviitoga tunisiensis]|nr:RidA family protein [Defluviitoga tunisiensis]HOK16724.1 RidA family protein [Defluviitoga tunisiensis]HOL86938.1 RidA family protein [Defluviitoga tunisiensis]HPP10579.1 RidA family protein [Defluviitoga tunisiensis]
MKEQITTSEAPKAIGPYSQAVRVDGFLFISGILPIDPKTGQMVEMNIRDQTLQVMNNLEAILEAAGLKISNVVKTTIFLKDLSHFNEVNDIYGSFFSEIPPARSCIEVSRLPKDALIEIEAIAR